MLRMANFDNIQKIADNDVETLIQKGVSYGDSWKRRGGVGAFMMLARKMDRIENIAHANGYDIFKVGRENIGDILDDIRDLRAYLLLVEDEVIAQQNATAEAVQKALNFLEGDATPAYVKQG